MSVLPLRLAGQHAVEVTYRAPAAKRCLDVVVAGFGLFVLAPLLLAIAVAIKCTSRGPALFRQERLGLDGRPFTLLKFRTMCVDADDAPHRDYVTQLLTEEVPAA